MNMKDSVLRLIVVTLVTLPIAPAFAKEPGSQAAELVDQIIHDIVLRTSEAAAEEVRRHTGIDPTIQGYRTDREYSATPDGLSGEDRKELQQLAAEHNRKIRNLQEELDRKLQKAQDEFEREARKERKAGNLEKKKRKLQEKVNRAYTKFEEKIANENERFDEKRSKILAKSADR